MKQHITFSRSPVQFECHMGQKSWWNRSNLRFTGIFRRVTHDKNSLKFGMLMYPGHLQSWLDYGHGLLILFILAAIWLSETGEICSFWAFSEEQIGRMAWNLTCRYISWLLSELIRFWSWSVDFSNFCPRHSMAPCLSDMTGLYQLRDAAAIRSWDLLVSN